jgi:phosphoglycerate dehydrogenase-like enzyme
VSHTLLVLGDPTDPELALLEELPPGTRVVAGNRAETFRDAAPEADAILNWSAGGREMLRAVLAMAPGVRWVHARPAGLEQTLFPELVESPVQLTNGRGVFSDALGEFAIAAALFFAKDLRRMVRSQAAGMWDPFHVRMLAGRTMGIVGYGDIGRAAGSRARALGMRVLALRRHPEFSAGDPVPEEVLPPARLPELLAQSEYLVMAAPATAQTSGMIGARELALLPAGAVVINVGRAAVLDEAALAGALERGRLRGAALDVFEREPLPAGHPFYRLENVLLSPHCADHTADWKRRAMRLFLENFARFARGEPLRNVVDKRSGY